MRKYARMSDRLETSSVAGSKSHRWTRSLSGRGRRSSSLAPDVPDSDSVSTPPAERSTPERSSDDDLDIELQWPSGAHPAAVFARPESLGAPPPGAESNAENHSTTEAVRSSSGNAALPQIYSRIDVIHHLLTSLSTRLESASPTTDPGSELVNEIGRLGDRLERATSAGSAEILSQVLALAHSLGPAVHALVDRLGAQQTDLAELGDEIRQSMSEVSSTLRVLGQDLASLTDLVSQVGADQGAIGAEQSKSVASVVDSFRADRDRIIEELGALIPASAHPVATWDGRDVLGEVEAVREEITQLRRRIGLRARTTVELDQDQLARVAEAVISRLLEVVEIDAVGPAPAELAPETPRENHPRPPRRPRSARRQV